jgi:hypothetical protein
MKQEPMTDTETRKAYETHARINEAQALRESYELYKADHIERGFPYYRTVDEYIRESIRESQRPVTEILNDYDEDGIIIITNCDGSNPHAVETIESKWRTEWRITHTHAEVKPLSGVQEYAIDLYERGFNVFPIPSAHDWNLRGETKKTPYKAEPLYRNRMHYVKGCECTTCQRYNFITLFEDSNIAIMCGANSDNLLSIDCDSQEAFKSMGDELTRRGLVFWAFTSHRGGQYLLRIVEGEAANIPQEKSKLDDVQVWGYRHLVVIPPSIHPKGTVYTWLSPEPLNMLPRETLQAVSIDALDWLGVTLKKFSKSEAEGDINGLPEYAKNLLPSNQKTLLGVKQGGRNDALCALANDLVGIGLDEDEVESALRMAADNCTPPFDDRDHKIEPILKGAFSKPRTPGKKYRRKVSKNIQDWQRAQVFAVSFDWRAEFGGKSFYARRVFNACIKRARLDSRSKVFRAAGREVATLANMKLATAQTYLNLLVGYELLIHVRNEASKAKVYSFGTTVISGQYSNIDILLTRNDSTEKNAFLTDGESTDGERDAFHGLGVYAYSIWRELLVTPVKNAYQLAKRLKLNEKTVGRTLARLVLVRLASYSQSEGAYYGNSLTEAQLEVKAADRGTAGNARGKRAQYVKDREKYVNRVISEAKAWHKMQSTRLERTR